MRQNTFRFGRVKKYAVFWFLRLIFASSTTSRQIFSIDYFYNVFFLFVQIRQPFIYIFLLPDRFVLLLTIFLAGNYIVKAVFTLFYSYVSRETFMRLENIFAPYNNNYAYGKVFLVIRRASEIVTTINSNASTLMTYLAYRYTAFAE